MEYITPIIKIVGDCCNLRCDYCFYNKNDQHAFRIMSKNLLEKCISEIINFSNNKILFIWHGGEPLLAGKDFFRNIVILQNRYKKQDQKIRNSVQTNATLIDEEWAEFFRKADFRVGVSLDGGKLSHDAFRKNSVGEGSHEKVLRGINILRRNGVKLGIIQTLTKKNFSRCDEDFSFFTDELGLESWGINPFFDQVSLNEKMKNQGVSNEELFEFFKKNFDNWIKRGDPKLRIREMDNFLAGTLGKKAKLCNFNGNCAKYICVDYDGKVYPCDRFSGQRDFLFGDLLYQSLKEVLWSNARERHINRVNSLNSDCVSCEWVMACHNGCAHHRLNGVDGKYYYCTARKDFFAYLKNKFQEIFKDDHKIFIKEVKINAPFI